MGSVKVPLAPILGDGRLKVEQGRFSVESIDDIRDAHEVVLRLLRVGLTCLSFQILINGLEDERTYDEFLIIFYIICMIITLLVSLTFFCFASLSILKPST